MKIPVYRPCLNGSEARYVDECLKSGWISSRGEFIERFEIAFSRFVGDVYSSTVANGTVALHLALHALGIGEGDEVIVPTFTYVASVNSILQVGAKPVFVDCDRHTWNVDPTLVSNAITPRTKAIMAVHLYGLACDLPALRRIANDNSLFLIEDAAEAFGSRVDGKLAGSFGDVATFSFFGNKTITTGEGGMVVSRSKELIDKISYLKSQAVSRDKEYWHDEIGFNYRMTNLCAAIGLAQLERADEFIERKRDIAQHYKSLLSGLPVAFQQEPLGFYHSYWMVSITLNEVGERDRIRSALGEQGVETRPHFFPAHFFPHLKSSSAFPNAEVVSASGINLPSFPSLTDAEIARICEIIQKNIN